MAAIDQGNGASKRILAGLSIAACSLTAGSIYCFPLFGPSLTRDLGLSLLQTNTIWGGAVFGQYFSASLMGHLGDTYGPRPLALIAAFLFGTGYVLMAHTEYTALQVRGQHEQPQQSGDGGDLRGAASSAVAALTFYFVLVGAGVAASVFGALRSSTSHFGGTHPGLALSVPLTLFGLSSLLLSSLASLAFFTDPQTGDLDGPKLLAFLGVGLMLVNAIASYGLSSPTAPASETQAQAHTASNGHASESSPLLSSDRPSPAVDVDASRLAYTSPIATSASVLPQQTAPSGKLAIHQFAQVPAVWALALVLFAAVGGAEMVMSSVGSIVVSLRYGHVNAVAAGEDKEHLGKETLALRASQVQLIAIANTVARLVAGLVSDLCSPSRSTTRPSGSSNLISRLRISRMTMLLGALLLLLGGFLYAALFLDTVRSLWIVSLTTGLGYGLTFTLVPSTVLVLWPAQFGRNYGLLTYAAATGSLAFSMLFAAVNDANSRPSASDLPFSSLYESSRRESGSGSGPTSSSAAAATGAICKYGRECFEPSFLAASAAIVLAIAVTLPLWRAWRHSL